MYTQIYLSKHIIESEFFKITLKISRLSEMSLSVMGLSKNILLIAHPSANNPTQPPIRCTILSYK